MYASLRPNRLSSDVLPLSLHYLLQLLSTMIDTLIAFDALSEVHSLRCTAEFSYFFNITRLFLCVSIRTTVETFISPAMEDILPLLHRIAGRLLYGRTIPSTGSPTSLSFRLPPVTAISGNIKAHSSD